MIESVNSALKKAKATGLFQQMLGGVLALFFGLCAVTVIAAVGIKDTFDIVANVLFAVLTGVGIWLIIKGTHKKKIVKLFFDYIVRLERDPSKSIDLLAASTGTTVEKTTKNLTEMVSLGFFRNAYLDANSNRVVLRETMNAPVSQAMHVSAPSVRYVAVHCRGCGAPNKIIAGTVGECEYCGSQISEN